MIHLHRHKEDPLPDLIERKLADMVISHKIHRYENDQEVPEGACGLPYLQENRKVISGDDRIKTYLRELENELRRQRMVSGDACYIDPETGELC